MIKRTATNYSVKPYVTETAELFVGATLGLSWNSTRVMSDVWETLPYATVWDGSRVSVVHRDAAGAVVDATPEVVAAANDWLLATAAAARKREWDGRVDAMAAEALKPSKGKMVKVVKGRKVPKGTTGEVFWVGPGRAYGYYDRPADRLGIRDADGTVHWTAATNVEVLNADEWFDFESYGPDAVPDFTADAKKALDAPPDRWGYSNSGVSLRAGEDSIPLNWFSVAAPLAAAA